MELENFRNANRLRASIDRHNKAVESIIFYEQAVQNIEDPVFFDRFKILDEYYPKDIALPIIEQIKAWHLSKIAEHEAEFAKL